MNIVKKLEKLIHRAGYSFSYFSVPGISNHMSGNVLVCKRGLSPVIFQDMKDEDNIVVRMHSKSEQDLSCSEYENCLQEAVLQICNMFADDEEFNQANHDKWFELYESPVEESFQVIGKW